MLWHDREPVGICVFTTPAASLTLRSRYFGLTRPRRSTALAALNAQLWLLARVVLHPAYRGAGLAAPFVRRACQTCPVSWIETLTAMGHVNPFFERAGFRRIGVIHKSARGRATGTYGTANRYQGNRFSEPVYYLFDNRCEAPPCESASVFA